MGKQRKDAKKKLELEDQRETSVQKRIAISEADNVCVNFTGKRAELFQDRIQRLDEFKGSWMVGNKDKMELEVSKDMIVRSNQYKKMMQFKIQERKDQYGIVTHFELY